MKHPPEPYWRYTTSSLPTRTSRHRTAARNHHSLRRGLLPAHSFPRPEPTRLVSLRDYTLISVGQIDDRVATYALSKPCVHNVLQRNLQLANQNLEAVDAFASEFTWAVSWTPPLAGTTAFVKFVDRDGRPINNVVFCQRLQEQFGVMLVPGSQCFCGGIDFRGYVRIDYVQEPETLLDGLQALRLFMRNEHEKLPVA